MNILSLGDDEAQSLGIDPMKTKIVLIITTTLMTAVVVFVSGIIGWVGLVIPHAGRLLVGPDHHRSTVTISLGAAYMLILDDLARGAAARRNTDWCINRLDRCTHLFFFSAVEERGGEDAVGCPPVKLCLSPWKNRFT